ncbi:MAG: hypothetical protein IJ062_02790 [Firmicutes bacterium]|nr:hypothetical protein [Bacillota bacterium]
MKNFLTKAFVCAGVMASALALSSVCAFAEQIDYTFMPSASSEADEIPTWLEFGKESSGWTKSQTSTSDAYVGAFEDAIFTTGDGSTGAVKGQYSYKSGNKLDSLKIKTSGSNAEVKLYLLRENSSSGSSVSTIDGVKPTSTISVDYDRNKNATSVEPISITFETPGEHKILFSNPGIRFYKAVLNDIKLVSAVYEVNVTDGANAISDFKIYNGDGAEIVPVSGQYSLYKDLTYTVKADDYVTQTFVASDSSTINVTMLQLKSYAKVFDSEDSLTAAMTDGVEIIDPTVNVKKNGGAFENGRIISTGLQGKNAAQNSSNSNAKNDQIPVSGWTLKVTAQGNGKIGVYASAGDTGSSGKELVVSKLSGSNYTAVADYKDVKGELKYTEVTVNEGDIVYCYVTSGSKATFYGVTFTKDGDTIISNATGKLSAFVNDGNIYAVATIGYADVEDPANKIVNIKNSKDEIVATSSNVYTSVKFDDNNQFNAKAFGGDEADYVYAYKITNTGSATTDEVVAAVNTVSAVVETAE